MCRDDERAVNVDTTPSGNDTTPPSGLAAAASSASLKLFASHTRLQLRLVRRLESPWPGHAKHDRFAPAPVPACAGVETDSYSPAARFLGNRNEIAILDLPVVSIEPDSPVSRAGSGKANARTKSGRRARFLPVDNDGMIGAALDVQRAPPTRPGTTRARACSERSAWNSPCHSSPRRRTARRVLPRARSPPGSCPSGSARAAATPDRSRSSRSGPRRSRPSSGSRPPGRTSRPARPRASVHKRAERRDA